MHVPTNTPGKYLPIKTLYTPDLPTTIISPVNINELIPSKQIHSTSLTKQTDQFEYTVHHKLRNSESIQLNGILIGNLCYTSPIIPLNPQNHDPLNSIGTEYSIHQLSRRTERMLWHQRLAHCSDAYLYNAHKHILGVPKFPKQDPILDNCPTCFSAKMRKRNITIESHRPTTTQYEALQIDIGFTGQKSKNERTRQQNYRGINGETCYIVIHDYHTKEITGECFITKGAPYTWLKTWLQNNAPRDNPNLRVRMDQGSETYRDPRIRKLFEKFKYKVEPTGSDSSHQIGSAERTHQTIGYSVRALLQGANLPIKFWPYAFRHYLRIKNSLPQRRDDSSTLSHSAHELSNPNKPDFSNLRTFGCRVWVRKPGKRTQKLLSNAQKGIFLGYLPSTMKNIIWYDTTTKKIKIAYHVRFDEANSDLSTSDLSPNIQHLQRLQNGEPLDLQTENNDTHETFTISNSPFQNEINESFQVICQQQNFGFTLNTDELTNRVYISTIKPNSSAATICKTHRATSRKYTGAYITKINNKHIFTKTDAEKQFKLLKQQKHNPITITLAPEPLQPLRDRYASIQEQQSHDNLLLPNMDDNTPDYELTSDQLLAINKIRNPDTPSDLHPDIEAIEYLVNSISSQFATDAENSLPKLTRQKLKQLDTWQQWQDAEFKQLDQFHQLGMFGPPQQRPPSTNEKPNFLLNPMWSYRVKPSGERRSRNCCDGSPRAAPILHQLTETYSSCIEVPIYRLFTAITTALNYIQYGGDAQDAYAHSPAPSFPCFVRVDQAFKAWYKSRFNKDIKPHHVLPVRHALQGHPEAGLLWEQHINSILQKPDLNFKSTTHERNIYTATINGTPVLLARQVDDFALASPDPKISALVYQRIGAYLKLPKEDKVPFKELGILNSFNGIDVQQTRHYTKLSNESYLRRFLKTHQWDTESPNTTTTQSRHFEPIPPSAITDIYNNIGPSEHTKEHADLATKMGFSYRQVLGEIMYAYVSTRPDIGYAINTLAKFTQYPAPIHYRMLKRTALYLRHTITWGIIYWRTQPNMSLPEIPFNTIPEDPTLPTFPHEPDPFKLVGFVDAAHANDLRKRRSTTGYAFFMASGVVIYRCKTQPTTATSSTEAELIAGCSGGKVTKYLRFILQQLGFPQSSPTVLYEDNEPVIKCVNARKPTTRSRHIDIQHFAIQEWKETGILVLQHIKGTINPAELLTKALPWVLHLRHSQRIFGHHGCPHFPD